MKTKNIHLIYLLSIAVVLGLIYFFYPIYYSATFNNKYRTRAVDEVLSGVFRPNIASSLADEMHKLKNNSYEEVFYLLDGIHNYQNFDKNSYKSKLIITYTDISNESYYDQENKNKYFWYSSQDSSQDLLLKFEKNMLVSFEYIKGP